MKSSLSRRKFMAISAAAGGLGLAAFGGPTRAAAAHVAEWNGLSLGSVATIRILHPDRLAGERLLRRVVSEAQRLEAIFSLYRPDSIVCELNRRGVLVAPPAELVDLLGICDRFWNLTGGVFDPSVQPLWQCYTDHFSRTGASTGGPGHAALEDALRLVGWSKVRFGPDRVGFDQRGMALTFNGIAQGYITDRVVDLLREAGVDNCLVDMGEIRTLGVRADGQPWQVALRGPTDELPLRSIDATNKAVATSGAEGFQFNDTGRCNHLFNPATGHCAEPARSFTVIAADAATADALSTAFALANPTNWSGILAKTSETQVFVTTAQDTREITAQHG